MPNGKGASEEKTEEKLGRRIEEKVGRRIEGDGGGGWREREKRGGERGGGRGDLK